MAKLHSSMKFAFFMIGLTFIGLFVATYITVKISQKGHEKIVDPAYYEKGMNYEKTISANRKLIEEGYNIVFEGNIKPVLKAGKNEIKVFFQKNEEKIEDAKISMKAERGATYKYDQVVPMKSLGAGLYSAEIDLPSDGNWIFTFNAGINNRIFEKSFQLTSN